MKSFALLGKNNAEILEGRRIYFSDDEYNESKEIFNGYSIVLRPNEPDGWLVYHPGMGPCWIFFNVEWVEKMFENLGEI